MINILKGKLNQKNMSKFVGVLPRDVDKSLSSLSDLGYIRYQKIKGMYDFRLYPQPIKELEFSNEEKR